MASQVSSRIFRIATVVAIISLILLATTRMNAQWQHLGPNGSAYGICVHDETLFAGLFSNDVFKSTDHGTIWTPSGSGITHNSNWWLEDVGGTLYCGTQFGAAFRSTDDGATWIDIGLAGARGFTLYNDTLYACEWYTDKVHWSADMGTTWTETTALTGTGGLWPMTVYDGHLYVGAQTGGVRRLAQAISTWTNVSTGLTNLTVYAFTTLGDTLFCAGGDGVSYTTDGTTWTSASTDISGVIYALHQKDGVLYAGRASGGVMRSTDGGASWESINQGLTNGQVVRLTSDDIYLYAGTLGSGVFRLGLAPPGTGITEQAQQYLHVAPNPATDIVAIALDNAANMNSIGAIDTSGRHTLLKASRQGDRLLTDVSMLANGMYLLEVITGNGVRTCRLVVQH